MHCHSAQIYSHCIAQISSTNILLNCQVVDQTLCWVFVDFPPQGSETQSEATKLDNKNSIRKPQTVGDFWKRVHFLLGELCQLTSRLNSFQYWVFHLEHTLCPLTCSKHIKILNHITVAVESMVGKKFLLMLGLLVLFHF